MRRESGIPDRCGLYRELWKPHDIAWVTVRKVCTEVPREDQMNSTMHTREIDQQYTGQLEEFFFISDRVECLGVLFTGAV